MFSIDGLHENLPFSLDIQKQLLIAISTGQVNRVDHLITLGLQQNMGAKGLFLMYMEAAKGVYKPNSYTEEESNGAPSLTYLQEQSTVPPLVPSPQQPTSNKVSLNPKASVSSVPDVLQSSLMFDEIVTEKRICWDPKSNNMLGICRQHSYRTSVEFVNEDDMKELFRCLDDKEVHYVGEATIAAVGVLCKNNKIYPAQAVMASGDCKRETGEEHAVILQTVLNAKLRIRRLAEDSSIYNQLRYLTFLNLYVGDDDLTCDKDFKHIVKQLCNLVIRAHGISINGRRIMPDIITGQLKYVGLAADHLRAVFNPDDKQDVKLAYDLLWDIWSIPCTSPHSHPGFLENCEALSVLGKFAFHLIFPYLCVDLSLSEQIEHLSAAAHLSLALYKQAGKEFLPTNLYVDIHLHIKNVVFCITKAKADDPNGEFWIILLGADRLEELFGILRTMVGNDANLDMLQLVSWLAGTTEVSNILAQYPHFDQSSCRLRLPALTQESKEVPDGADHIKPGAWRGNVKVADVSLQISWKRG
ncbi:hypothetical protein BDQ17DRAFT_1393307 [Cyathus striatus]|nr:hypothetical protein BDQ17DRAFT_1393307 [Cyathus striatus]